MPAYFTRNHEPLFASTVTFFLAGMLTTAAAFAVADLRATTFTFDVYVAFFTDWTTGGFDLAGAL